MLKWALIFLVVALIAGALGFTGLAGAAMGIAKFLFFIFLVLFVLAVALGLTIFRSVTQTTQPRLEFSGSRLRPLTSGSCVRSRRRFGGAFFGLDICAFTVLIVAGV